MTVFLLDDITFLFVNCNSNQDIVGNWLWTFSFYFNLNSSIRLVLTFGKATASWNIGLYIWYGFGTLMDEFQKPYELLHGKDFTGS